MTEEIQLRFDYEALDTETRRFVLERTERIHNLARMTATGIVQIGQYLSEVKARLGHGKFLDWIKKEFGWAERSARRFMEVHEAFKSANLADMQIDVSALYLIAAPKTPEPVRTEVIRRAENGEPATHAGTRALVERFAETGELPEVTISLPQLIAGRRAVLFPEPKAQPPSLEDQQKRFEEAELRARMKANSERNVKVFDVIHSIEHLSGTPLTVSEIAAEIRQLDTPDKDWHGQLKLARQKLTDLCKELSS
jgi:hypothetical protein